MHTVKESVEALGQAFAEFKETNDERLEQIETKGAAECLVEEKLERINQEIDETTERLNQVETAIKRPALGD